MRGVPLGAYPLPHAPCGQYPAQVSIPPDVRSVSFVDLNVPVHCPRACPRAPSLSFQFCSTQTETQCLLDCGAFGEMGTGVSVVGGGDAVPPLLPNAQPRT